MNVSSSGPADVAAVPSHPEPQPLDRRHLAAAVQSINESELLGPGRTLTLGVDPATRKPIVQIVNSETRDVLDQIPSEQVLQLQSDLARVPVSPASGSF